MTRALTMTMICAWLALAADGAEFSALWGRQGEAWDPAGRLPDVSFAGYACGERPIPKVAAVADVRDFGAKGDGTTDDSAAFLAAIAKVKQGAISVPPGRYRITRILEITRSGVVLRGAGPDRSVLVCPLPLNDIKPNMGENSGGRKTSEYSWGGGIVWFKGSRADKKIGPVAAAAKRGDHKLTVTDAKADLKAGTWIAITARDDASKSLLDHLYSGDPGNLSKIKPSKYSVDFVTRISAVGGRELKLERPLRTDLRPEWQPVVHTFQPTLMGSGIEDLAFEFPARKYGGHFTELGFNAVAFSEVSHCWVRNLLITNADSGIFLNGHFCSIDGLRFQTRGCGEADGVFGHHGVSLTGDDNLLTHFDIRQRFIHDITVGGGAGNVASAGSGTDLSFDHHKRAPYDNVFTDIDLGFGSRMWKSGGGDDLGRHCGAYGTFWNIRAVRPQVHPGAFGPPAINLVGVKTSGKSEMVLKGRWFEAIPPARLEPTNLHEAQRNNRLSAK